MKNILLLFLTLSFSVAYSQEVMESKVEFQKTTQPSVMVSVPYTSDVVEDAIKDYFNRMGVKADDSHGFLVFKSARLSLTDTWNSDLYFKVERKSRKEKDESIIYFFATPENQQPNLRKPGDQYGVDGARNFLRSMLPSLDAYNLQVQISIQEEEVRKAEKKYQRVIDEGDDLDKKLKKVQENIEENKNDRAKQKEEMENQRKRLRIKRDRGRYKAQGTRYKPRYKEQETRKVQDSRFVRDPHRFTHCGGRNCVFLVKLVSERVPRKLIRLYLSVAVSGILFDSNGSSVALF